jgi:hypothetical protein
MAVRMSALRAGRHLPLEKIPNVHFCRDSVDPRAIARMEELGQMKNPMASRIEPATFQLLA